MEVTQAAIPGTVTCQRRHVRLIPLLAIVLPLIGILITGCEAPLPNTRHPIAVWAADPRQEVSPSSRGPNADDAIFNTAKGDINLSGAINETVAFQLAMHSGVTPVKAINIQVSPLRNQAGQDLRATVKVYRAWPVDVNVFHPWQRLYRNDSCTPRQVYDILVPAESRTAGLPTDLPTNTMLLTWLDVRVEKGTEPGKYAGTVRVTSQGQTLWTLNMTLNVQPFALPDAPAMPAIMRFNARQLARMHLKLAGRPYAPIRLSDKDPLADKAIHLIHATARMLNEHGIVGVPVGYEPAMHVDAGGAVRLEWEDYDRLIQPLIDGSAFDARIQPIAWPLPLDDDHPPMPGNIQTKKATYQNLLQQVAQQSADHFRLRKWDAQAYVEIDPDGTWPDEYVRWQKLIIPSLQRGDRQVPILLRLPAEDLGTFGWYNWPDTRGLAKSAGILSTAGHFFLYDPAAFLAGKAGPHRWLRPDYPPFSPSLQVSSTAVEQVAAGWAAWRLRAVALDLPPQKDWPESTKVTIDRLNPSSDAWLIWPGAAWDVDEPVPSIRLKRLRTSLQECKYLYLLRQHGRIHVDELLAESLVPLAGSLAFGRQQSEGLDGEIQLDPALWRCGIDLMTEELNMAMTDTGSDDFAAFTNRIAWQTFLQKTRQIRAWAEPARLFAQPDGTIRAQVPVEILNLKAEPVSGTLGWSDLTDPWQPSSESQEFGPIQPFQRTRVVMTAQGPGIGADSAGHTQWTIRLEPQGGKPADIPAVVSAVAVIPVSKPLRIDGDLSDWPAGRFNQMADFKPFGSHAGSTPAQSQSDHQTHAFVASDGKMLYIAARMQDSVPQMRLNQCNTVQYDAGLPVGEDLLEILIDPDNGTGGGAERLTHIIVKSNGAAVANLGVDVWPPVCQPQPLGTRVTAAAKVYLDCWMAEVAIPLSAIKAVRPQPAYWGLGICRLRASNLEYTSWSGVGMSCYDPSSLGNVLVPNDLDGR